MRFYRGLRMKVWRLGSGPGSGEFNHAHRWRGFYFYFYFECESGHIWEVITHTYVTDLGGSGACI